MSYALPERQREYQREWARKKKALSTVPNLSRGTITWKELTQVREVNEIQTYKECVTKARDLLIARKVNRLAIAALAIRSCRIRYGGDFRSKNFKEGKYGKTLLEFATEIGIQQKSLHRWIFIKTQVFDKLSDHTSPFDYTAAEIVSRYKGQKADPVTNYYRLKGNAGGRNAYHATRYSYSVLHALVSSKGSLDAEQKKTIKENLRKALTYL